ncbi:MAG: class I SAM-dependent methyltransferase [Chloroflexota bacterium]|nr:class I SAM-dependent methyltransferase [Chloroflexota bacterium]
MAESHRYHGSAADLRSPEKLARLEVGRVVDLSLEGMTASDMLDVGTGTAVFAEAFAARGLRVAGVDGSSEMLALARGYVLTGDFRLAQAEVLPFPSGAFDLVFMGRMLHETDDAEAALAEARRVARQRVAVLEWPYLSEEHGPPLEVRLSRERLGELAAKAGFARGVEAVSLAHLVLYRLSV